MSLINLTSNDRTPGTMSTPRQRLRIWMELHRVGGPISPWVRLALTAQLRTGATTGGER